MHQINGRIIARKIEENLKGQIRNETPCLATLKIGENASSTIYRGVIEQACKRLGIKPIHIELPLDSKEKTVIEKIGELNDDETIHGILIHHPIPSRLNQQNIIQAISPLKDVDGLHPLNMGALLVGNEFLTPCTPAAVIKILDHEKIFLQGKDVVIINHSSIIGKPLAIMLLNRNATVTICHVHTLNLQQHTKKADILITGTGVPGLITEEYIKKESTIIDIGITQLPNGTICGDVNFSSVSSKAKAATPVPGGVGPVTVATLMENSIKTYKTTKKMGK
jgi:methylenetetrahydrofolate dehydrogenase (NADP+)/methenyltetrahydrofolate cyclohydrolase